MTRVTLTKKQTTVDEIAQKTHEGLMSVPQACKEAGIEVYTYYNWKKRVDQLKKRSRAKYVAPVIIRRMPVQQAVAAVETPKTRLTRELPPQKCAIIFTDANEVQNVLREFFQQ